MVEILGYWKTSYKNWKSITVLEATDKKADPSFAYFLFLIFLNWKAFLPCTFFIENVSNWFCELII